MAIIEGQGVLMPGAPAEWENSLPMKRASRKALHDQGNYHENKNAADLRRRA